MGEKNDSASAKGASAAAEVQVSIDNFAFTAQMLTVKRGASITWVNHDDIPHTVDQDGHLFASPVLDTNQKFQHVFAEAGQFPYYYRLHPKMTGNGDSCVKNESSRTGWSWQELRIFRVLHYWEVPPVARFVTVLSATARRSCS